MRREESNSASCGSRGFSFLIVSFHELTKALGHSIPPSRGERESRFCDGPESMGRSLQKIWASVSVSAPSVTSWVASGNHQPSLNRAFFGGISNFCKL
jgi:hypothetical protein